MNLLDRTLGVGSWGSWRRTEGTERCVGNASEADGEDDTSAIGVRGTNHAATDGCGVRVWQDGLVGGTSRVALSDEGITQDTGVAVGARSLRTHDGGGGEEDCGGREMHFV